MLPPLLTLTCGQGKLHNIQKVVCDSQTYQGQHTKWYKAWIFTVFSGLKVCGDQVPAGFQIMCSRPTKNQYKTPLANVYRPKYCFSMQNRLDTSCYLCVPFASVQFDLVYFWVHTVEWFHTCRRTIRFLEFKTF